MKAARCEQATQTAPQQRSAGQRAQVKTNKQKTRTLTGELESDSRRDLQGRREYRLASPKPTTSSSWRKKKKKGFRRLEPRSPPLHETTTAWGHVRTAFSGCVRSKAAALCCYDYGGCLFAFSGRQRASGSGHPSGQWQLERLAARADYKWNATSGGQM